MFKVSSEEKNLSAGLMFLTPNQEIILARAKNPEEVGEEYTKVGVACQIQILDAATMNPIGSVTLTRDDLRRFRVELKAIDKAWDRIGDLVDEGYEEYRKKAKELADDT